MWEKQILIISDDCFFYEQGLRPLIDSVTMTVLDVLYHVTDGYTDRWLSSARAFLEQCSCVKGESNDGASSIDQTSKDIHILVTSGALIPCLLFRLDTFIRHENVIWFEIRLLSKLIIQNEEGVVTELYIPRKCSATNRLITSKDHASVQLNVGHLDADGIYTGQFSTFAFCGFVRFQGDADSGVDRLWHKKKVEAKHH